LSDGATEENIGLLDGLDSEVNKEGRKVLERGCHVWVMMASSNKTPIFDPPSRNLHRGNEIRQSRGGVHRASFSGSGLRLSMSVNK
jgi:hypothetical protein